MDGIRGDLKTQVARWLRVINAGTERGVSSDDTRGAPAVWRLVQSGEWRNWVPVFVAGRGRAAVRRTLEIRRQTTGTCRSAVCRRGQVGGAWRPSAELGARQLQVISLRRNPAGSNRTVGHAMVDAELGTTQRGGTLRD